MADRDVRKPRLDPVAWLRSLAAIAVIALLAAQIVVVAMRYVFSMGWPWATDLLTYLFFLIVSLPLASVLLRNESVRVDVLSQGFSRRRRRLIDRIALLVLLFPSMAWAAWTSVPTVRTSWRVLEASPTLGGMPGYFVLKTILALAFAALAVLALVLGLRRRPYPEDESE